jgi:hypothetical protein
MRHPVHSWHTISLHKTIVVLQLRYNNNNTWKQYQDNTQQIPNKKIAIRGTSHITRKVLQAET